MVLLICRNSLSLIFSRCLVVLELLILAKRGTSLLLKMNDQINRSGLEIVLKTVVIVFTTELFQSFRTCCKIQFKSTLILFQLVYNTCILLILQSNMYIFLNRSLNFRFFNNILSLLIYM